MFRFRKQELVVVFSRLLAAIALTSFLSDGLQGQQYDAGNRVIQNVPPIIQASSQDSTLQPQANVQSSVVGQPASQSPSDETARAAEAQKKAAEALAKKVAGAHKPVFYDNDFSYIHDPNYMNWQLGDSLKQLALPGCGVFDIGGQYRSRAHFESNHRGLGLTGVDDKLLLHRTRIFGNFRLNQDVRVYAEMLDAESHYENAPSRPIEVNRFEMQNLFVDLRLLSGANGDLSVRTGRQELLFGAQRVVSPLDWANTRRTFEGVRVTARNETTTVDGFWVNPMRANASSLDSPDRDQEYMGVYASSKLAAGQTFDAYFFRHLNGLGTNNFRFNTVGMRSQGDRNGLLWDVEAAYQFGENTNGSAHSAGMATFGLGRKLECHCWDPTLWFYYDYASGDNALGAGNGYHHGFPLAHKYNGFMDLFGRRNLEDLNVLLTMQPSKRLKLLAWYHYFFLATQSDSPYSVVMTPFNGTNAPGSTDLGHEIDFTASYRISARQNLVLGYSHFFSGQYYSSTAGTPYAGDANFWYSQWTINF